MATYYVSTARGSDANNGTSPSTPYATIGKALGTSAGAAGVVVAGDTVYVEPGIYRELVKLSASGSSGNVIAVQGDVDGSAFRAGGYATPATGEVQLTPYTTNDKTQCGTTATLNAAGKPFYSLKSLTIIGSRAGFSCIDASSVSGAFNWTVTDCYLPAPTQSSIGLKATAGSALNWTIDRCIMPFYTDGINLTVPYNVGGEYNLNVAIQDCWFYIINGQALEIIPSGTAAANQLGYGVTFQGCTSFGGNSVRVFPGVTQPMTNRVCTVKNCNLIGFNIFFTNTPTSGTAYILEDYNVILCGVAGAVVGQGTVTSGGHSVSGNQVYSPLLHFGQELLWGGQVRPFLMPTAGSPYLNFGDGTAPAVDITGRNRPEGS